MRVLCIKIMNPITRGESMESHWLSIDNEYAVLSVEGNVGRSLALRLVGDDGMVPGLWPAEMFLTVSSEIPVNWVAAIGEGGQFNLGPAKWLRPGFWENYFNGDPQAVAEFDEEKDRNLTNLPKEQ